MGRVQFGIRTNSIVRRWSPTVHRPCDRWPMRTWSGCIRQWAVHKKRPACLSKGRASREHRTAPHRFVLWRLGSWDPETWGGDPDVRTAPGRFVTGQAVHGLGMVPIATSSCQLTPAIEDQPPGDDLTGPYQASPSRGGWSRVFPLECDFRG